MIVTEEPSLRNIKQNRKNKKPADEAGFSISIMAKT